MPKGSPKPQTIATAKYEAKGGWKREGYKFHAQIASEFEETCKRLGVSKTSVLESAMKQFIEQNKQG